MVFFQCKNYFFIKINWGELNIVENFMLLSWEIQKLWEKIKWKTSSIILKELKKRNLWHAHPCPFHTLKISKVFNNFSYWNFHPLRKICVREILYQKNSFIPYNAFQIQILPIYMLIYTFKQKFLFGNFSSHLFKRKFNSHS